MDGAAAGAGFIERGAEAHPVKSKRQRTAALGVAASLLAMARAGCFNIGKGLFRPAKVIHSSGCATGSAAAGLKPGKSTFQVPRNVRTWLQPLAFGSKIEELRKEANGAAALIPKPGRRNSGGRLTPQTLF